jgi:hypothetical protein
MVEEAQENQKKWHNHVERMPPTVYGKKTYFYHPVERWDIGRPGTLGTTFFYLEMGHDSVLEQV